MMVSSKVILSIIFALALCSTVSAKASYFMVKTTTVSALHDFINLHNFPAGVFRSIESGYANETAKAEFWYINDEESDTLYVNFVYPCLDDSKCPKGSETSELTILRLRILFINTKLGKTNLSYGPVHIYCIYYKWSLYYCKVI